MSNWKAEFSAAGFRFASFPSAPFVEPDYVSSQDGRFHLWAFQTVLFKNLPLKTKL